MRIDLKLICLSILFLAASVVAYAQDTSVQEQRKAKLEREIAIIDKQLSENASKSSSMLTNLTLIRKKVSNRKQLVAESDKTIKKYSDEIYLKQRQINRMQARLDTLSDHYSKLILSAYKNRDARVWYMYMLASDNLGQAFRRYGYFKNLSSQIRTEADDINELKAQLEEQRQNLVALKKEAEKLRKERAKELEMLNSEEKQAASVVKKLKNDRKKYEKQLNSKKKEINALNREIERIVAAAMKPSKSSSGKSSKTEIDTRLAAEFAGNKGLLPWPVDGAVVGRFGKHYHPVYKNLELPPNNGIDIAVNKGEKVQAIFNGVVKQIIVMPGFNQCVLVQHGNYFSFYCKLDSVSVKAGEKVKAGQKIGTVDTINGQNQLHFQIWKDTKPQNPESWLK